ncbi:hypothetical protein BKA69DRAFT_1069383 [Paraphysoderma sedebokerense]|nr:hypothetical protein BKA69DRAFT_1069383 [Paraphysoderma sedebokerense]
MAACSVATAQKIAVSSCLGGMAISLAQRIYTSPEFFALRRNKYVFSALVFGSACCVIYFLVAMHGFINPTQYPSYLLYWSFFFYSACLYAILLERVLPLISISSRWSHEMRLVFRYGGPLVLAIPQFISAVIATHISVLFGQGLTALTIPVSASNAAKSLDVFIPLGTFIMLLSNSVLSYIFVHALAQHRKQTFKTFIMENRVECLNLLFNFVVACGFLLTKIAGSIFRINPAAEPFIFNLFHNFFSPIVTLNTFNDYLFVTKKLPRDILSTQIEVSQKSTPTGTKSKSPGLSTRVSEAK